jgi:predicted RNA binding protein YcfA (HicA-like mRNA interferase family)
MWKPLAARRLRKDIRALDGKKTGYSYSDLETILCRHGFRVVSKAGSHRTLKHALLADLYTFKDDGKRDVKPVYIKKALNALKVLQEKQ